jgi:hypothetical protein
MYKAIQGIFENGSISFSEPPPNIDKSNVIITFLDDNMPNINKNGVRIGSLVGKGYDIPKNFDDAIDDFNDYI